MALVLTLNKHCFLLVSRSFVFVICQAVERDGQKLQEAHDFYTVPLCTLQLVFYTWWYLLYMSVHVIGMYCERAMNVLVSKYSKYSKLIRFYLCGYTSIYSKFSQIILLGTNTNQTFSGSAIMMPT